MKLSLNWLQDFVDINEKDPRKIKDIITANTAEVETMQSQGDHLKNVVVGKVTELKKHPNADSLSLTKVDDGNELVQVVCGGSNLKEGMLVAFAKIGAVVRWHGSGVMEMKPVKIRGEESFGMICAAEEIGLSDMFPKQGEKEIVDLSHLDLTVGQPLAEALGLNDVVLDVDNHAITNRSDLFSHKGFAREFVANGLAKWREQYLRPAEAGKAEKRTPFVIPPVDSPAPIQVSIQEPDLCPRYTAVYLTGIEVKESPDWMKRRLVACGVNPISNIVDITNYVMLELGMPLHAFDLEQVKGKNWIMRKSRQGEKVTTLDGQEHELMEGVVVLDDGNGLFDLCGIMGGLSSGIQSSTQSVWLHAPVYNPTLVRRAMRALGHVSDAAIIYEKGVDNELAKKGLERAMGLILELCPNAKVASQVVDLRAAEPEERVLNLRKSYADRLIGVELENETVEKILCDLGFEAKRTDEGHAVKIPSFRLNDVKREADLVEEIARIYGYNNLPYLLPQKPIQPIVHNLKRRREKAVRDQLAGYGLDELYTFAFLGPELLRKSGIQVSPEMIEIENPISSDLSLMRTSLLPRTLETIEQNLRYQSEVSVFELNRVYKKIGDAPVERTSLIIAMTGERFKQVQGMVEEMGFTVMPSKDEAVACQHPGRRGDLVLRGKKLGAIYEAHPQILKNFDLKQRVTVAEIDFEALHEMNLNPQTKYQEIPRYPAVQLDVSVLADRKQLSRELADLMAKTDKSLIASVQLIDDYSGDKIPSGKRALTYSITYRSPDRTLTDEEVKAVHGQVLKRLEGKGVEVRR